MEDVNYSLLVKFNRFVVLMAGFYMCHGFLYFKSHNSEHELHRALSRHHSALSMSDTFYFTVNVDVDCSCVKLMDSITNKVLSQLMLPFSRWLFFS